MDELEIAAQIAAIIGGLSTIQTRLAALLNRSLSGSTPLDESEELLVGLVDELALLQKKTLGIVSLLANGFERQARAIRGQADLIRTLALKLGVDLPEIPTGESE